MNIRTYMRVAVVSIYYWIHTFIICVMCVTVVSAFCINEIYCVCVRIHLRQLSRIEEKNTKHNKEAKRLIHVHAMHSPKVPISPSFLFFARCWHPLEKCMWPENHSRPFENGILFNNIGRMAVVCGKGGLFRPGLRRWTQHTTVE